MTSQGLLYSWEGTDICDEEYFLHEKGRYGYIRDGKGMRGATGGGVWTGRDGICLFFTREWMVVCGTRSLCLMTGRDGTARDCLLVGKKSYPSAGGAFSTERDGIIPVQHITLTSTSGIFRQNILS